MKNQLWRLAFLFLLTATFTSCEREGMEEGESYLSDIMDVTTATVEDYPVAIDTWVMMNYPNTSIDEVEMNDDGTFEVELEDDTELLFADDGTFLKLLEEEDDDDD